MTTRAFIAAVEHYPESTSTSQQLPGTIESGERLARWLREGLDVARGNIIFCASGDSEFRTHGTATRQIKQAIIDLVGQGYNDTERLFVFLSGHGLMIPRLEQDLSILLCSDFSNSQVSGGACLEINEFTKLLREKPGGRHTLLFRGRLPDQGRQT